MNLHVSNLPVSRPHRVLLVHAAAVDFTPVLALLRRRWPEVACEEVHTRTAAESVLAGGEIDVVLCAFDPDLPVDALLTAIRESGAEVPLIGLADRAAEAGMIQAMDAGVRDVLTFDRLERLPAVILRELALSGLRHRYRSAEADLLLQQHRFQALVEGAAELIVVVDRDGCVTYATPAATSRLGYPVEELIGRSGLGLVHADDLSAATRLFNRLAEGGHTLSSQLVRCRHHDASWRSMELSGRNLMDNPAVRGIVLYFRDVTERREAERALQDREALYRATFDEAPIGIVHVSLDGRLLHANKEFARLLGYTIEELKTLTLAAITPPDDLLPDLRAIQQLQQGVIRSHYREKRYRRKDGELVWTARTASLLRDPVSAEPVHFIAVVEDITGRREAQRALEETRERLQAILDHSPALIYLKDLHGGLVLANAAFRNRFEVAGRPVLGRRIAELLPPNAAHADQEQDHHVLASAGPVAREITVEDGRGRNTYYTQSFALRDVQGTIHGIGCIATDISERKEMEHQFLQSQKMEAFGQLAGGVAHDFNNILAMLLMHFDLMKADPALPAKTAAVVQELDAAAQRASSIVRQLLIFSRRHELAVQVIELNQAVEGICKMLQRFVGENITLECERARAAIWVEADPGMIEQVVMNLCVNARDAMPRGGKLTVTLGLEHRSAATGEAEPHEYARLAVTDTGRGMDEETRKRVFEPFFTTKPVGVGTGLGLATVDGIARQHGGWVEVESTLGLGSTFRVFLPTCAHPRAESLAAADNPAPAVKLLPGRGRILLVEDEEGVRAATSACLRHAGYEVVEAPNPVQAMDCWCVDRGRFDLLLTDVVMPGTVTGFELADALVRGNPELKVIIMSGYSAAAASGLPEGDAVFVRMAKPFTAVQLLETVRTALQNLSVVPGGPESP